MLHRRSLLNKEGLGLSRGSCTTASFACAIQSHKTVGGNSPCTARDHRGMIRTAIGLLLLVCVSMRTPFIMMGQDQITCPIHDTVQIPKFAHCSLWQTVVNAEVDSRVGVPSKAARGRIRNRFCEGRLHGKPWDIVLHHVTHCRILLCKALVETARSERENQDSW